MYCNQGALLLGSTYGRGVGRASEFVRVRHSKSWGGYFCAVRRLPLGKSTLRSQPTQHHIHRSSAHLTGSGRQIVLTVEPEQH